MRRKPPAEVRHDWELQAEPTISAETGLTVRDVHVCGACGAWTAHLELYLDEVCPARDRRKRPTRRAEDA
jgi:hypothetical protein